MMAFRPDGTFVNEYKIPGIGLPWESSIVMQDSITLSVILNTTGQIPHRLILSNTQGDTLKAFPQYDHFEMPYDMNYAYCNMRSTSQSEKESGATDMIVATELPTHEELQSSWNRYVTTTAKRWSNIYNAFTLNAKMHSLGHPVETWNTLFAISDTAVEAMAEVEHNRWSVEELILGFAPTTSEEHKAIMDNIELRGSMKAEFKHDDLRNYSELGTDDTGLPVSRYDAAIIRTLPLIAYSYSVLKGDDDER